VERSDTPGKGIRESTHLEEVRGYFGQLCLSRRGGCGKSEEDAKQNFLMCSAPLLAGERI
jgi:hypothetical protein